MTIKFLVVVPTLNSYKLLPKFTQSLQSQTFQDWRCLFIDGPSSKEHRQWLSNCCQADTRFEWSEQKPKHQKIFGAMNQGFEEARPEEWILFWGSDDWAASSTVLQRLAEAIPAQSQARSTDLVIAKGRYANAQGQLSRRTAFSAKRCCVNLNAASFRRKLFLGQTPPHQGTLFSPCVQRKLNHYDERYPLAADLDYFLHLSNQKALNIRCIDLELIHMSDGGVSGQHTKSRFNQVKTSYQQTFGSLWWIPFISRYIRRLASAWKR
ncbi:glycosyltransferase [Synechococcus sp. MIT S9452]|uniref:glycosyltransferase n=1 Tax=Synechococcus sp. MIT S9452 TaxID=3082546 RepID=UPI0039A6BD6F